jgi:SHS2 domain-containing protein
VICDAVGERLNFDKHITRTEVKAVTYHMLEVNENGPYVTVLFDI